MEYNQPENVQLDPTTGQYYTQQTYMPQNYGGNFMGGGNGYYGMGSGGGGMAGMFGMQNRQPITTRKNTGDRSMVWEQMQNRQPYQYNAPSVAEMFSSMSMPNMNQQYTGGAGQFLNGLLGVAPSGASV